MSPETDTIDWRKKRTQWCEAVVSLMDDVEGWVSQEGWACKRFDRTIREDNLGEYVVPQLQIATPQGTIVVNPIGRNIIGAEGRVDLESFPSLNRILLIRRDDEWKVFTEAGVDMSKPWGRDTFLELARNLAMAS